MRLGTTMGSAAGFTGNEDLYDEDEDLYDDLEGSGSEDYENANVFHHGR